MDEKDTNNKAEYQKKQDDIHHIALPYISVSRSLPPLTCLLEAVFR